MILPIGTDCPPKRRPTVNYLLIASNVIIFLAVNYLVTPAARERLYNLFALNSADPELHQFITYAFMHARAGAGGWSHLIGNMLFLYIFGNSLNDKLGHLEYLLFYLGAAIVSGGGYALMVGNAASLVGASGAIAAVTTAFLVLFPRSRILILFFYFVITTFEIPSLYLIAFKFILLDNVIMPWLSGPSQVAHGAHLAGYLFGFCIPFGMLALGVLPRDQFDIFSLISRWRRRRVYRSSLNKGNKSLWFGLKQARPAAGPKMSSPPSDDTSDASGAVSPGVYSDQEEQLRESITRAVSRYDLATAADTYLKLLEVDPNAVLPRREQLDVSNQLMSSQRYDQAAQAYEKYIKTYPAGEQIAQVKLLLGIIYSRHLDKKDRARDLLSQAYAQLGDESQRSLCQSELNNLKED